MSPSDTSESESAPKLAEVSGSSELSETHVAPWLLLLPGALPAAMRGGLLRDGVGALLMAKGCPAKLTSAVLPHSCWAWES